MSKTENNNAKYSVWTVKHKNVSIIAFLAIFFLGYTFFFLSPQIIKDGSTFKETPYNVPQPLGITKEFTITNWEYSERQHLMEVMLTVDSSSYDGLNTYYYSAITKSGGSHIEIVPVVEEPSFIVLQIKNISNKWENISLRITSSKTETDDTETLKLYSSVNTINVLDNIETLSKNQYYQKHNLDTIELIKKSNTELSKDIVSIKDTIVNIEQANKDLSAEIQYQTADEVEKTNSTISANIVTIKTHKDKIAELQAEIQKNNEKIEKLNQQNASLNK